MKLYKIVLVFAVISFHLMAWSQDKENDVNSSNLSYENHSNMIVKNYPENGFLLGLNLSGLDFKLSTQGTAFENDSSSASTYHSNNFIGFTLGYLKVPKNEFGFLSQIHFIQLNIEQTKLNLYIFEGSGNYALKPNLFLNLGLNLNYLEKENIQTPFYYNLTPLIGYQAGISWFAKPKFNIDLSYIVSRQKLTVFSNSARESLDGEAEFVQSGLLLNFKYKI